MKYDNSLEKVKLARGSNDKAFSNSKTVKARKVDSLRTLQEKNGNICNSDILLPCWPDYLIQLVLLSVFV